MKVSSQKFIQDIEFMLDMIPRVAQSYGLSVYRFLLNAEIVQSSIINARKRIEKNENVQGFNVEFFFKLKHTYPDLNIACFFDKDQPIRGRRLYKIEDEVQPMHKVAESAVGYSNQSLLEAKEKEIELLRDKVKLMEELLDRYREGK